MVIKQMLLIRLQIPWMLMRGGPPSSAPDQRLFDHAGVCARRANRWSVSAAEGATTFHKNRPPNSRLVVNFYRVKCHVIKGVAVEMSALEPSVVARLQKALGYLN